MTDSSTRKTLRERLKRADKSLTVPASVAVAEQPPGVLISHVYPGSMAERAGIKAGDTLFFINGEPIRDTVDFFFHASDEELFCEMERENGEEYEVELQKSTPEDIFGVEIEQFTTQNCGCNCVFCFVHQLPDNMRKSLYVQDEDYRLSFMEGSYITGMNLKDSDLNRIAEQRLAPLYLSTHAIDEEIRKWLLGLKKARPILEILEFFKNHNLELHTQIVLCPGKNDAKVLEDTLDTLENFFPTVQSIAIVPVGLTKWRDGLPELTPVDKSYANKFIRQWTPRMKKMEEKFGFPLALLADEWYLIAGRKAPAYSKYPDLPQLENGVGMVYHFYKDFKEAKKIAPAKLNRPWRVAAMTSTLSPPVLEKVKKLCDSIDGLTLDIIPITNTVFGDTIHVTGLLTGQDIGRAIKHTPFYDQYLIPGNCLRKWDERFIDDITLDEMRRDAGKLISPVLGGSLDFMETILEEAIGLEHEPVTNHPFLEKHWSNN